MLFILSEKSHFPRITDRLIDIFIDHTVLGVVIRKHSDHPLEFRQKLNQPRVWFGNDNMMPQLSGGLSRKRDIVATREIKNRLQANGVIQVTMQNDQR